MLTFRQFLSESIDLEKPGFHVFKHGKATLRYQVHSSDSPNTHVELNSLRVPKSHRKLGHGNAAMQEFVKHLDDKNKTAKLLASPLDKIQQTSKLVSFYKKHGFEETGERGNTMGDPWMIRNPNKKK